MGATAWAASAGTDIEFVRGELEQSIEKGELKLPVLPLAVQKVLAINSNPDFSVNELSSLIHQDHTLAGHVLRVSNSSIYAGTYKISSLSQAISRLGRQAMVKIAVSITMQGEVFQVIGFKDEIKYIWHHSLASAVYAQEISDIIGQPDPEMYMCGLMHQVGKPVLLRHIVEIQKRIKILLTQEEMEALLEAYHKQVGFKLATAWKMPASVKDSCLYYQDPATATNATKAVNITHLASLLADLIMAGEGADHTAIYVDPALAQIGMSKDQVDQLIEKQSEVRALMEAVSI